MDQMTKIVKEQKFIKINYIKEGIKAKGHTPIYKFHKYFARRPYNVFEYLIESYTQPNDLVVDCFCGGGVTVVEGARLGRKTVGVDANPLAVFVTESQLTPLEKEEYKKICENLEHEYSSILSKWYKTECRSCSSDATVRWYEHAYIVKCTSCGMDTPLDNNSKFVKDGKKVNGHYTCNSCNERYKAVDMLRLSERIISLRYRCSSCGEQKNVEPNKWDVKNKEKIEKSFNDVVAKYGLKVPEDKIPDYWDRQQEDCLHRKGFFKFKDLFTRRNLLAVALLKRMIQIRKSSLTKNQYRMLLFTFSATLRYLNNLNFSTDSWMGGRPVAWAKHAFWTPNQFVEVNPVEYLEKRKKAFLSSLKYQNKNFELLNQAKYPKDILNNPEEYSHCVVSGSSSNIDLPDESVCAVITDPPYGSNVQYGELSSFWLVWLKDELEYLGDPTNLHQEVLTHRKTKEVNYAKTFQNYYEGLYGVFSECYRILKKGGPLVFTFNNKNLNVWFALIKSVLDAGFILEKGGVIYQEPIEIYKDTSHSRHEGALQGDFIYTFRKINGKTKSYNKRENKTVAQIVVDVAIEYFKVHGSFTKRELHIECLPSIIPVLIDLVQHGHKLENEVDTIDVDNLEKALQDSKIFSFENKKWTLIK
jgi:putative DNA methylase